MILDRHTRVDHTCASFGRSEGVPFAKGPFSSCHCWVGGGAFGLAGLSGVWLCFRLFLFLVLFAHVLSVRVADFVCVSIREEMLQEIRFSVGQYFQVSNLCMGRCLPQGDLDIVGTFESCKGNNGKIVCLNRTLCPC